MKKSTAKGDPVPLSWEPKHRPGGVYCAPDCGRGCTEAEFDAATEMATRFASALGPGWAIDVWENLGWHGRAVSPCGRLWVSPSSSGGYRAYLNEASRQPAGQFVASGPTPKAAVREVLKIARAEIARLSRMVEGL